jgi:alkaline phosphatase D
MIDGRQYRSREACYAPPNKGGGHLETDASCPERREAGRTMMGFAQEAWLRGARPSKAQWNVIAQDVLMAQCAKSRTAIRGFWTDDWDGYPANRARLLKRIHDTQVSNPVVVGGDIHAFFANDLRTRFRRPDSPVVATEFVGTSISSYGVPPYDANDRAGAAGQSARPHFFESRSAAMSASISNGREHAVKGNRRYCRRTAAGELERNHAAKAISDRRDFALVDLRQCRERIKGGADSAP